MDSNLTNISSIGCAGEQSGLGDLYVPINAALEDTELLESWGIGAGKIDTVVCMQVLCSVSDPVRAAEEIYRLLWPGGQLLFWEHQASRDIVKRIGQRECNFLQPDFGRVLSIWDSTGRELTFRKASGIHSGHRWSAAAV